MRQAVAMVPRAQTIGASGAAVSDIYIYMLQAPIDSQVTPMRFWTLILPGSDLSGYIPGTDAEPHTSDYQAFHLADCTNLQTTKLCRLHHFGIYTAPKYSQRI